MHSACEYYCACIWYCILVKFQWFYICSEPMMIMIVLSDGFMTKVSWDIVEDVDDSITHDLQPCEKIL